MRRTTLVCLGVALLVLFFMEIRLADSLKTSLEGVGYSTAIQWLSLFAFMGTVGAYLAAVPLIVKSRTWEIFLGCLFFISSVWAVAEGFPAWVGAWNLIFALAFGTLAFFDTKTGIKVQDVIREDMLPITMEEPPRRAA